MYQPTGEDVKSDEERSIESEDLQKDEISDLFDHSAEDLEETSLENPSDLTTAPTLGVPQWFMQVDSSSCRRVGTRRQK
jgi:hypothetical protein